MVTKSPFEGGKHAQQARGGLWKFSFANLVCSFRVFVYKCKQFLKILFILRIPEAFFPLAFMSQAAIVCISANNVQEWGAELGTALQTLISRTRLASQQGLGWGHPSGPSDPLDTPLTSPPTPTPLRAPVG